MDISAPLNAAVTDFISSFSLTLDMDFTTSLYLNRMILLFIVGFSTESKIKTKI